MNRSQEKFNILGKVFIFALLLRYDDTLISLKAAVINIFIITMDQMTICIMKDASFSDKPTENYHLTLLSRALEQLLPPYFAFCVRNFTILFLTTRSKQVSINQLYTANS